MASFKHPSLKKMISSEPQRFVPILTGLGAVEGQGPIFVALVCHKAVARLKAHDECVPLLNAVIDGLKRQLQDVIEVDLVNEKRQRQVAEDKIKELGEELLAEKSKHARTYEMLVDARTDRAVSVALHRVAQLTADEWKRLHIDLIRVSELPVVVAVGGA